MAKMMGDLSYSATLHGDLPVYGKDHAQKFAGASWVSAVTRPLHEQIVSRTGFPAERVPVIWMGVDTAQLHPKTEHRVVGRFQFVTVARLIAQKGHHDALQAIALLRASGLQVGYVIAGSGPFEGEIRGEISRLGLEEVVSMAGNLSEDGVRRLLESSDAFVLPSYGLGEAAPVSVMEAMACGLPVIATRIGGTPDMIRHLEDGWLVPQNDVESLSAALGTIARDQELRARLGKAAREKALAMFDHKVNAGKLLDWITGRSVDAIRRPQDHVGNILLIMEQCNPLWPSVPRVAFEIYRHLAEITGVTLVTHARNREGLRGCLPDADIHFIEESAAVQRYYSLVSKLAGGRGTNWPLLHALGYPVYAEFDRQVYEQFGWRVADGQFRAVMVTTPILPRYPYSISKACRNVPFILGPVNGGLPFPKGFGRIASQEYAGFNFLRRIGQLLPGYAETYRSADRILAGSEFTLGWLRRTFPESSQRMVWMPENGLGRRFFIRKSIRGEATPELNILFAGRLVPYKGADILLDAVAMAQTRTKRNLRLRIVGDGPMRKSLERQAGKLGLAEAISFSGQVTPEQMPAEFEKADLFCFPSVREFGGAVVLEAMASGTPCVVVDHGGIGEYVTEACGVKVKPESRTYLVVRFADAIVRASVDESWLEQMSDGARVRAEEFSWEAKVRRIEAIIAEVTEERAGPKQLAA
jgi:glycosyltransferase involved in cell wall biosynthesis